jgi:hypothetical protein
MHKGEVVALEKEVKQGRQTLVRGASDPARQSPTANPSEEVRAHVRRTQSFGGVGLTWRTVPPCGKRCSARRRDTSQRRTLPCPTGSVGLASDSFRCSTLDGPTLGPMVVISARQATVGA